MKSIPQQLSLFDGKVCTRCGRWLPQNKFSRNTKCLGDREPACRLCYRSPEAAENKRKIDQRYYRENKERLAAYTRQYQAEHREKIAAYQKEYRRQNAETLRPKKKAYRSNKREADPQGFALVEREKGRAYRLAHPEKLRETYQNTRAKRIGAEGRWTKEEWTELIDHYGTACLCCGKEAKLHRDHIIPLAKGGRNDILNLQPLCHSCNSRKHVEIADYRSDQGAWAEERWGRR